MSEQLSAYTVRKFFHAIHRNYAGQVQHALNLHPELINAISKGYPKSGPLHAAACSGALDVLDLLVKRGADPQKRNYLGRIALHYAVVFGKDEAARYLLKAGSPVDSRDDQGQTPLYTAAKYGRRNMIALLLKDGALVDARDNRLRTPLMNSAWKDNHRGVRQLLKAGAHIDAADREGRRALHFVAGRSPKAAETLVIKGAQLEALTLGGRTPLGYVARNKKRGRSWRAKWKAELIAERSVRVLRDAIASRR